jgi:hypothetical protein
VKHKVAELEGGLLDAAVALADGRAFAIRRYAGDAAKGWAPEISCHLVGEDDDPKSGGCTFAPSSYWLDGGPIIERERIAVVRMFRYVGDQGEIERGFGAWVLSDERDDDGAGPVFDVFASDAKGWGATYLQAAMRAFVSSKLGEEVELP